MRLSSLFIPLLVAVSSAYADDIQHPGLMSVLARANGLLSAGKYADAARAYSEAIELSPSDYMIFYRRGTAHMSLQRHPQALSDFQRVLQLTNSPPATTHLQIARLLAKNGDFVGARAAVKTYNTSANSELGRRETQDVLFKVSEAEGAWKTAEANRKAGLWTACVESATVALTTASHASEIRGIRAECGISGGDIELGVSDLARLAQIAQPSTALFMRIFRISYLFLPPSPSSPQTGPMAALKSCLHYDPDSKPCKQAHRLVKALDKVFVKLDTALSAEQTGNVIALAGGAEGLLAKLDAFAAEHGGQDQLRFPAFAPQGKLKMPLPEAQKSSPRLAHVLGALCRAHTRVSTGKRLQDAANLYANRLLNMDLSAPQMESVGAAAEVDALVLKGEAAMAREDWEEAARVLGDAFEKSGRDRDVYSRFSKAQRLLKQSKQKDYYKVLGVSRDADARTIKKAFRTAAKTAHPDKGGSEAKMAAVNEAYEVLSNPELRARFDNGDDPNDPAGAQGGPGGGGFGGFQFQQGGFGGGGGFPGGHPFAQFFSGQGGGGGAQFHFRTG